jgi:hypothetical protein
MYLSGYQNVPGAPGNLLAGNPFGADFTIPPGGIRGMSPEDVKGLKEWDPKSSKEIEDIYKGIKPGGPRLPLVQNQGSFGGMNTLLAQALPGGQAIGNVQGMMQSSQEFAPMPGFEGYGSSQPTGPSPEQLKALQTYDAAKQQQEAQRAAILQQGIDNRNQMLEAATTSRKPVYLDVNAVPQGIESIGAGARVDLGRNQNLNFQGMYTPGYTEQGVQIPQGYTLKAGYGTPGLDINLNYREGRRGMGPQGEGGFGAEARFKRSW